jgi:putative membrane protein
MQMRCSSMKTIIVILSLATGIAFISVFGADQDKSNNASAAEKTFIKKATDGGMTEVELGKVAEKNAEKQEVKDFGSRMVKDHGKANDDLKSVASTLKVTVPDKVSPKHKATIDRLSKKSGATFDTAYVKEMVADHEKDIAEFEKAKGEVKNEDLKKFIDDTVPVMKEHLEMVKKLQGAK